MKISTDLQLSHGNYTFARITKCEIFGPGKTFAGIDFTFNLEIAPTQIISEANPTLQRLLIDLYIIKDSAELFLGQLKDRFISPASLRYSRNHQQHLELSAHSFLKLVDETHHKDLELKLRAQAVLHLDQPVTNSSDGSLTEPGLVFLDGESRVTFPHSDWLKLINNARIEYFDLITLRTTLPELPEPNVFVQAFGKLHEAQNYFNRGDWNAVGAACRSAFRTILPLAGGEKNPIQKLLATAHDDPKRKRFVESVVKALDVLGHATHQEGNFNYNTPPADFQREDALLTLHLTAAAISYIASVYK